VPRLAAAGADLDKVHIIAAVKSDGRNRVFNLAADLASLRRLIADIGDVKLIIIDPITSYLGGNIDTFRDVEVRSRLEPVAALAEEAGVAVIGIMHFNKKVDVTNVVLRISNSLAFAAVARSVYAVVDDPDNQRKLLVKGNCNLAPSAVKSLAYGFNVKDVGVDKRTGNAIKAPHIEWFGPVDVTAVEAMKAANGKGAPDNQIDLAKEFLSTQLLMGARADGNHGSGQGRNDFRKDPAQGEDRSGRQIIERGRQMVLGVAKAAKEIDQGGNLAMLTMLGGTGEREYIYIYILQALPHHHSRWPT
jgi:putative DNA primase/helicase